MELGAEAGHRPGGETRVEIGDLADHVRQTTARTEAGSALEVDEDDGEAVWRVSDGEVEDKRLEQS